MAEVADLVRHALARNRSIEIVGGGSKREIGQAIDTTSDVLSLAGLAAVLEYTPEELLLTVQPGARLLEVEALLAAHGQQFAFEPPHLGVPFGYTHRNCTVGGMVSAGLAGSRRFRSGSVRDHVLALQAVNGRGELFRAGGKVVKNVTGFDLPKLLTGAWGTLAVLTEITLKVTPAPASSCTIFIGGLDLNRGAGALRDAAGGPWNVTGAAWLPEPLAGKTACPPSLAGMTLTALRLEGIDASVSARSSALVKAMLENNARPDIANASAAASGVVSSLHGNESIAYWRDLSRAACMEDSHERLIFRASVPPASGAGTFEEVLSATEGGIGFLDGAGGTIWLSLAPTSAHARTVREIVSAAGGQALIVQVPGWLRSQTEVFDPMPRPLADLSRRLKEQFDPQGILNPRRMYRDF